MYGMWLYRMSLQHLQWLYRFYKHDECQCVAHDGIDFLTRL